MDMMHKMPHMMHHHGHHGKCCGRGHSHGPKLLMIPPIIMLAPLTLITTSIMSVLLLKKMTRLMAIIAYSNALGTMGDRLSDIERAELESRVRARAFGQ